MIKYLGSKRILLPRILGAVGALPAVHTVVDLFSGTSRVGHALKRLGYRVLANDHNAYAATLARCYVAADRERVAADAQRLLQEFGRLPGRPAWFTATYCEAGRYLQPHNGARIEAIRDAIAAATLAPDLEAVVLVALMEAADRVDSTTGVQMAYLKRWSERSYRPLELRLPEVLPRARAGPGEAHELDALAAIDRLEGDVLYVDPPYNEHKYLGNYHVWETLVRWDRPAVFGKAQKRIDCKQRRSVFNSRRYAEQALRTVLQRARARHIVVSFSDEGFFTPQQILAMLAPRGRLFALACAHPRYVGARIGIYNPAGEKVGVVSHVRNREFLFVATPDDGAARALLAQGFDRVDDGAGHRGTLVDIGGSSR